MITVVTIVCWYISTSKRSMEHRRGFPRSYKDYGKQIAMDI